MMNIKEKVKRQIRDKEEKERKELKWAVACRALVVCRVNGRLSAFQSSLSHPIALDLSILGRPVDWLLCWYATFDSSTVFFPSSGFCSSLSCSSARG
jgi:hypothetical protein